MNKKLYYLILYSLFIFSCVNENSNQLKKNETLKIKELGILKPFKCTIFNYSKKFDGYIVPYLYYIQNDSDSNIYKLNIETSFGIKKINNSDVLDFMRLEISNSCQIYDTSINTITYDDFNPLLPRKSFHCLGFLTFIKENSSNKYTPSPINILDDGELLKYMNSNKQIETKFEVTSTSYFYDSHSLESPKFETIMYDTSQFMKDILKINNINHKTFNGGENLNKQIYNYIYTLLTKSKDDFIIQQKYD